VLELEHDNLRAALAWALEADPRLALGLAATLWRFWLLHGHLREGRRWTDDALARDDGSATPERAAALNGAGALAGTMGDYDRSRALFEEDIELFRALGDDLGQARALSNVGLCLFAMGERERAMEVTRESLGLLERIGEEWPIAVATLNLGSLHVAARELEEALRLCARSLELFRRLGDGEGTSRALLTQASVEILLRRPDVALGSIEEGLNVAVGLDTNEVVASFLDELAALAAVGGRDEDAARLLGAAAALREVVGVHRDPQLDTHERILGELRGRMDEAGFEQAFERGRSLDAESARALGLDAVRDAQASASPV
jgi:tetratricopeptide (TPR) repeat protein